MKPLNGKSAILYGVPNDSFEQITSIDLLLSNLSIANETPPAVTIEEKATDKPCLIQDQQSAAMEGKQSKMENAEMHPLK